MESEDAEQAVTTIAYAIVWVQLMAHVWSYCRAYNKAALVLRGEGFQDRINFKPAQQYEDDVRRVSSNAGLVQKACS
jgi:hypothetical protein